MENFKESQMIRSSSEGDGSPDCNSVQVQQQLCNKPTTNSTHPVPVFNIHIHVPPYNGTNLRIEPVIHLHFDEIAKKLEIHREDEEKTYRMFRNMLVMATPKFGNVTFHHNNRTIKKEITESETNRTIQCSPEVNHTDTILEKSPNRKYGFSDKMDHSVSSNCSEINCSKNDISSEGNFDRCHNNQDQNVIRCSSPVININKNSVSSRKNVSKNSISPEKYINRNSVSPEIPLKSTYKEDYKLKKAVVILTDICKSKYYRDMIAKKEDAQNAHVDDKCSNETNDLKEHENENLYCDGDFEEISIKSENFSFSSDSFTSVGDQKVKMENSFDNESEEVESSTNNLENDSIKSTCQSLTALAEGCNFSEILNRFKLKCEDLMVDSEICTKMANEYRDIENETCIPIKTIKEELNTSLLQSTLNRNPMHTKKKDQFHEGEQKIKVGFHNDKNTFVFGESQHVCNNSDNSLRTTDSSDSLKGETEQFNLTPKDNELQSINESDLQSVVDVEDTASESGCTRERVLANSHIQILSSSSSAYLVPVGSYECIERKRDCVSNVWDPKFQNDLIRKEMDRRNKNPHNKRKDKKKGNSNTESSDVSSAKKMKHFEASKPEENTEISIRVRKEEEVEFIPLKANGPTKFSLAPLSKISPYKNHSARSFKEEMLYGNRVNRFSSADQLRTEQLKVEAMKKQSN